MNIDKVTLNNGLNTLFIDSPGSTSGTVQIWFRAGSALEKKDHQGIAHFLEHMFFKGTPKRPGPKLAHEIESYGGEVNAFTSFDYTCYYINTPNQSLNESVDILLDMVSHPLFSVEDIPAERQVVFEEYRRAMDNPNQFNFMQLQKSSFTGGYKHPILGREQTILNFSQEQIKSFRQNFYNLENSLLVVAGDLKNRKKIENKITAFQLPSGKKSTFGPFKLSKKATLNIHEKDIRQASLTMCFEAPRYEGLEAPAEDLAINCLAHGETSRLYQNLVASTSLCNGIAGSTMYFSNGGVHMIKMNFPLEHLDQIHEHFISILSTTLDKGFISTELEKIKNQYISSKVYERESLESYAFSLGHGFAQNGQIFCEDEFIEKMRKVTTHAVTEGLCSILKRPSHFTLQIPKGSKTPKIEKTLRSWQSSFEKTLLKRSHSTDTKGLKTSSQDQMGIDFQTSRFDPAVHLTEIKPGVKFLYRQNKLTPTFVLHTYIKGGQSLENKKNAGIHHLLSRLLTYGFKTSQHESNKKNGPSVKIKGRKYHDLKNDLEFLSASLNGFSGKNAFGLTMHGQTKDYQKLFEYFFGTLNSPEIPKKFFDHEKKVLLRSLENQKEDPLKQAFKEFYRLVFHQHPYSLDISGNPETIKTFSPSVLRTLHEKHLMKSEMVITYCGDLDYAVVLEEIKKITSILPRKVSRPSRTQPSRHTSKLNNKKSNAHRPKGLSGIEKNLPFNREQTQILIGRTGFSITEKEDLYLKMVTAHLSGQSSDLFVEVRDRLGLCYSVAPIHVSALEAGCWAIYIGSGHDKVDAATKAIMKILNDLRDHGLKRKEFERIKKMINGQNSMSIQTNEDYAQFYSIAELHHLGLDFSHEKNELIKKADYSEFQTFLQTFFDTKWNIVTAGQS